MASFRLPSQVKIQYGDRILQFRPEDVTVTSLSKIFHLIPDTIILISEDGTVCVPQDQTGRFDVEDFLDYKVEGDLSTIGTCGMPISQLSDQPSTSKNAPSTRWKPKSFPIRAKLSAVSSYSRVLIFYEPHAWQ
jgi:hypothetical protein